MHLTLSRRALLAATAATLAASAADDLGPIAEAAAIWGFPLVQVGRYLALAQRHGVGFNRFHLNETLATPDSTLAGANIDTIYGYAWLDLSAGPVLLQVPQDDDGRYYAVQFIDAYQTIIGYVGHRETGIKAGITAVAGPGWSGALPPDVRRIDSPTSLVLVLTRTLVRSARDLAAAQRFQLGYRLSPLSTYPHGWQNPVVEAEAMNTFPRLDLSRDADGYFSELDALLRRYPPRGQEAQGFGAFAKLGLGRDFKAGSTVPSCVLQKALAGALDRIAHSAKAEDNNGWKVNYHILRFNPDPIARAAQNVVGPGAHTSEEALYFVARADSSGAPLTGASRYRIVFPKGQLPPAGAFWSMILYGADMFLVSNTLNRYAITDRTEDLKYDATGALTIVISHAQPEPSVNWLPAPAGNFFLVLRTYEPNETLRNGVYRVPPITREA